MKTSKQYPKMVMIIRHGEKPGNPDDEKDGGPHLSILGSARAAALPSLFTPGQNEPTVSGLHQLAADLSIGKKNVHFTGAYSSTGVEAGEPRFPTPDFLFATKADAGSNRPVETITPLMQALKCFNDPQVTINSDFSNDHNGIKDLKKEILLNPIYAGKVILICWHHGKIPKLVKHLGAPANQLPWSKWPSTIFDLILRITWENGRASLVIAVQQLLHGDSNMQQLLHTDMECSPNFTAGSVTLVLDAPMKPAGVPFTNSLPMNFRSMKGIHAKEAIQGSLASGSAQYSPGQLQNMISQGVVQRPLTVVDLRQESHGFLSLDEPLNDESEVAVSWFAERDWINVAKGLVSIESDESDRLRLAAQSQDLDIAEIDTKTQVEGGICTATPHLVHSNGTYRTEQALLQAHNIGYLRLPTTDRCRPRDSEVDQFIVFELTLEEDRWLHFHCRAGDGRTTTFMAMHDIFHNAPDDSLDFILGRQEGLGGVDLRKASKKEDQFEYPFEIERMEFMKNFYAYVCRAKPGGFNLTWSDWVIKNATQV